MPGRQLKPRKSYTNDAAFLLKLGAAIGEDNDVTPELRRQVINKINDLSSLLNTLKTPVNGHSKNPVAVKAASRGK